LHGLSVRLRDIPSWPPEEPNAIVQAVYGRNVPR
jgi:hypothetical protein